MINDIEPMKYIAGSAEHMMAISVEKKLFGWGNNTSGQLGIPKSKIDLQYQNLEDITSE